ncbi:Na+/H+ antiporter subunit E [Streptomyces sp. DG2A-72]|uniref:Na+/H+ antiporter subunit E n=1 Tax=Streptomyces sp. DG2A-72 TaxID=3051386 RepID=UPI00265C33E1|nr:Na+/H+ antiporter subunit E [Streptomyces sp. DG2A-72]MDO0938433.1 Na+/H+ antiporter subunit E [Streptomyces sp. DG2A-72]
MSLLDRDSVGAASAQQRPRYKSTLRFLRTAPFAVVFWLLLSGHFEPLLSVLGALSVAVVCWLTRRADLDHQSVTVAFALRLPRYFLWLSGKVLVSTFAVARKVWSPRPALRPVVEPTPAPHLPELSQVVYANSITLTPGTLSLDVEADHIEVHSLEAADVEELREGLMLRRVRQTEARR